MPTVIEIAHVPLVLDAAEPWLSDAFHEIVVARPARDVTPELRFELTDAGAVVPAREPDDQQYGIELWFVTGGAVARCGGVVLDVNGTTARAHVPERDCARRLDPLVRLGLCWLLAARQRYVVHAAAVGRDDDALLVLGHSGMGKSTAVFAALDAGWWASSDDLVALEETAGGIFAVGIHQAPAAPLDIGGGLLDRSQHLGDLRRRGRVAADVLSGVRHRVVGTIVVGHSSMVDGELDPLPGHQVMPLIVQSFAAAADARHRADFVRLAGRLSRLPAWSMGHSADPARRRTAAVAHLDRCLSGLVPDVSAAGESLPPEPRDVGVP